MSITYEEYNEKYRLPEQERDEQNLLTKKHFALCYEPGKGKSMPVIHCIKKVNEMKNGNAKVLILSDATCIKDMWKAEIVPMNILPKETYLCTDRSAIGKYKDILLQIDWDIIVCDECQSLRSGVTRAKSKYAKLVYQLTKKAEYVWGMTGTIAGNNDIEPFCVLHNLNIAGCGNLNCRIFKDTCCEQELQFGPFGSFQKPVRLNPEGIVYMRQAYEKGCSFWDYDDEDDMPDMQIENKIFEVPLTDDYKLALDGILKCGEFESTVMKSIALQKAQQTLNGFVYYNDESMNKQTYLLTTFENPKLKFVVNECKKDLQIVTYRFAEDGEQIRNALAEASIKYYEDIVSFKYAVETKNEHCILVLQCSRGKAANIQCCHNIIYYTSDFSFISYKQMIHRCWRRGQKEPCKVTFLINDPMDKAKIEEHIWESLRKKQSIHDCLMSIKNT